MKTEKELAKVEAQGYTCKNCQAYPCCQTVVDCPLPLCFSFKKVYPTGELISTREVSHDTDLKETTDDLLS